MNDWLNWNIKNLDWYKKRIMGYFQSCSPEVCIRNFGTAVTFPLTQYNKINIHEKQLLLKKKNFLKQNFLRSCTMVSALRLCAGHN